MSEQDPIRLFVTHAFKENEEYTRVFEYLESRDNFYYVNFSRPDDKPEGDMEAIHESIRGQIEQCEVVLFPSGVHSQDPKLIDFELSVAQVLKKPIMAIMAFGGTQMIPQKAMAKATKTVEWNDRAIIDTVKSLARGGGDQKWDVIEFDMDDPDVPDPPE